MHDLDRLPRDAVGGEADVERRWLLRLGGVDGCGSLRVGGDDLRDDVEQTGLLEHLRGLLDRRREVTSEEVPDLLREQRAHFFWQFGGERLRREHLRPDEEAIPPRRGPLAVLGRTADAGD